MLKPESPEFGIRSRISIGGRRNFCRPQLRCAQKLHGQQKLPFNRALSFYRALSIMLLALFVVLPPARGGNQKAPPTVASSSKGREALKPPANLIKIPQTRQATDYTCGVAALQSVLGFFGEEFREDELAKKLKANSQEGTAYANIARFAKKKGFRVDIHKGMTLEALKRLLDKRSPVICLIQAWSEHPIDYSKTWANGHYVVAIGYDDKNIFFMDPSTLGNYAYIPAAEFVKRWHDTDGKEHLRHFGMVVAKEKPAYEPDLAKFME
jgi:predicted double-glycine peptidase